MTEATVEARIEAEEETGGEPVQSPQKTSSEGTSVSGDPEHSPVYSDENGGRHDTVADAGSSVEPLYLKETKRGTESRADTARTDSPHAHQSLAALAEDIFGDLDGINLAAPATDILSSKVMSEEGRVGKQSETVSSFTSATSEDSLVRMETSIMLESLCKDAPASPGECRIEGAKELKGTKEHIDKLKNDKEGDDLQETNREANADTEEDTPVEKEGDNDLQNSSPTAMEVDYEGTKGAEEKNKIGPKDTIASTESIACKMTDTSASDSGNVETVNNLDEMMDMGTVDQVEQEAQMAVEEPDSRNSSRLLITNTVSGLDNSSSDDEKPIISAPPVEQDRSEDDKVTVDSLKPRSPLSDEDTTRSGGDSKSLSGMREDSKSEPKCENESLDTGQQSLDSDAVKPPPSPVLVKVKDEPMDEEYDRALSSSASIAAIKDEPDSAEELKISSVFSVGGNTGKPGSTPTAVIPKVVAQSDGSGQSQATLPLITEVYRVTCSHCKKTLMKGQTAYQRKGCPDLFCSTSCLSASSTVPKQQFANRNCHCCFKVIERPQDVILSPVDDKGTTKEFCSNVCLSTFNRIMTNKKFVGGNLITTQTAAQSSQCSVCKSYCICKHEVLHNGVAHKICTDVCFVRFRVHNNLNLANCVNCGSFCLNNPITLKLEDGPKTLCRAECLATYKKRIKTPCACIMCNTHRLMSDMLEGEDSEGRPALFCNGNCVMAYKIKVVSTSGVQYPCDNCGKVTTPTYHLAMSDASIRNFCTLNCVMTYQDKFNKVKNVGNGASMAKTISSTNPSAPVQPMKVFTNPLQPNNAPSVQSKGTPSTLTQPTNVPSTLTQTKNVPSTLTQPARSKAVKVPCFQCHKPIQNKPQLLYFKEKVVFLCSSLCSQEYQRIKCVASLCEYCKIPKVIKEVKRINNKDCHFCSEGCKLLYNHDLAKHWGIHCRCCAYCLSTTRNVMTSFYGGKSEEFCSEECRSQFVMLFYQVAKCHLCTRQGKLTECLNILGEVKYFCDLHCLLHHCHNLMQTQSGVRLTGPVPQSHSQTKAVGHAAGTQTDPVRAPPPPPVKILKNKALLCRPMVQNKGITCKVNTANAESQTDDTCPKVLILPVPVPVFLPVPMNMYSQYTPLPMGLPLPVPVPMFLPVATANAERLVRTIREIKDKIPSDPLEADLILMAEMVAEQDGKEEKEREKERKKSSAYIPDDHTSNYSDDLDADDLETLLNIWDDPSLGASNRTRGQEKSTDVPMGGPDEPASSPPPPTPPPVLDVEADFPAETLEMIAHFREQPQETPSSSSAPTRRQAPRRARNKAKQVRKSRRLTDAEEASQNAAKEPPKLEGKYGIDAWKFWIQRREKPAKPEKPRGRSFHIEPKEDILRCTTVELAFGLCHFVSEVRRPNGECYSPDSLYYLCLCIQHHLFENGRVENIFTDMVYSKFAMEISKLLKDFKPTVTASGYIHSRVEEEYLWECKQLGAYSPTVLLNTLLFFCCKHFGFTTVEQNRQLSFAHLMRCTRTDSKNSTTSLLRFYPPLAAELIETPSSTEDADGVPAAKKRKEEETNEVTLEMAENRTNPLRCPVRLYEFYLSKCSESVKQRANMFYLLPERSCVPTSPLWFSTTPLDDATMEAMLTRILTVREMLRLRSGEEQAEGSQPKDPIDPEDPSFVPGDGEEEDSE